MITKNEKEPICPPNTSETLFEFADKDSVIIYISTLLLRFIWIMVATPFALIIILILLIASQDLDNDIRITFWYWTFDPAFKEPPRH